MNNINYNNELVLTYKMFKKEEDSNLCYQIQLLQAFNMLKYDDFILQKNIESVYEVVKNDNKINEILLIISEKMKSYELFSLENGKNIFLFQLFFSYNYFEIFHKCFINYINDLRKNNTLKHDYFEELKTFVSNNDL
tara:strand:- start:1687 stop:2097 length:411 start_codon:yes stop_codon:yes gene_type:complete